MQIAKLKEAGCEKVFQEKKSGATNSERQKLMDALTFMREGDQLIVTRLDRLARSVRDLSNITKQIEELNVDLVVLEQNIDTSTPTGRLLFHMLGAI